MDSSGATASEPDERLFAERYRAVQGRDPRFDGQFYIAVSSTGIYCRPSCPARTPKPENARFFLTSAAAHQAGYRACKRCLPEATPGSPEWNLRQDLTGRAMRLIAEGLMNDGGVEALSHHLGYSSRHLHRVLTAELGAGPLTLARAQRAQTARSLLVSTELPAAQVAFAAGFSSVRQFNDTMREVFAASPSEIRGRSRHAPSGRSETDGGVSGLTLELDLPVRQPYDAPGVYRFLLERALPGIEAGHLGEDRLVYARTLRLPHGIGGIEVTARWEGQWQLRMRCELTSLADLPTAVARVRRMFDLDADPIAVDIALSHDPVLAPLVAATPGIRLPGTADAQEYVIRAIVGQQISVPAARTQLTRMAQRLGEPTRSSFTGLTHVFPTPEDILNSLPEPSANGPLDPDRPLRLTRRSIRTVRAAAEALVQGELQVHAGADPEQLRSQLTALPGIGRWTASYLALRVLGHPDDWMTGDVALVAGARRLGLLDQDIPTSRAHRLLESHAQRWSPWRSYAAMHLWSTASRPPDKKGHR